MIALDLALFLRENTVLANGKEIKITASQRGFLFTLMFRVGSNPFSWVSQEDIAHEMSMSVIGIKKLFSNIKKTGLVDVMKNPSDKRKNMYRPADFLINYHQQRGKNHPVDNSKNKKNYVSKSIPIQSRKVSKSIPIQSRKVSKSIPNLKNDSLQPATDVAYKASDQVTKLHKKQIKIKSKEKGDSLFFEFTKNEMQEAVDRDIDIQKCFNKFKSYKNVFVREDWEEWFRREKNGKKSRNRHFEQQREEYEARKKLEMGSRYIQNRDYL